MFENTSDWRVAFAEFLTGCYVFADPLKPLLEAMALV